MWPQILTCIILGLKNKDKCRCGFGLKNVGAIKAMLKNICNEFIHDGDLENRKP